jgi:hypothetical protein
MSDPRDVRPTLEEWQEALTEMVWERVRVNRERRIQMAWQTPLPFEEGEPVDVR